MTRQESIELESLLHSFNGGLSTARPADGFLEYYSNFFLVGESFTTVHEKCYISLVLAGSWEKILQIKCSDHVLTLVALII